MVMYFVNRKHTGQILLPLLPVLLMFHVSCSEFSWRACLTVSTETAGGSERGRTAWRKEYLNGLPFSGQSLGKHFMLLLKINYDMDFLKIM